MTLGQKNFRELLHTTPFKPFRLHLADGKSLRVPHPDFILAGAEQLVVARELPQEQPGELNIVPYEQVVRLQFLPRRPKKAA